MITIGILKEPSSESRVSMLSTEVAALVKSGSTVWMETGAGLKSFCTDAEYIAIGALVKSRAEVLDDADIILSINSNDIPASLKNKILIGVYQPLFSVQLTEDWNKQFATWTKSRRIRKPATFLGFRYDKNAKDVVREVPKESQ